MLNLRKVLYYIGGLKMLLFSYPGRDRSVTAAEVSNTYQFITLSTMLEPGSDLINRYTFRNA